MADHSSLVPPRTELSMGALKEACKVVQPRLCQASPENAQEHSAPKADDVNKMKDVGNMHAEELRAFAKSLGVEIR